MGRPLALIVFVICIGWCLSCEKEYSCENCLSLGITPGNQIPIANAGPDQTIALPQDSVLLEGTGSVDHDGVISSYSWARIEGPGQVTVRDPGSVKTIVYGLQEGLYLFQLIVTDNFGASDNDTVQVKCVTNNTSNSGFIFNKVWGCNDQCNDNDVYVTILPGLSNFSDPNIPLEVYVLDSLSQQWISVPKYMIPLPLNSKYYYFVREKTLFVHVVPVPGASQLLGKNVTVRVRFI